MFGCVQGKGQRLRDLENVEHRISLTRTTAPSLILLHRVLFPSHKAHPVKSSIKSHIRDFSGWTEPSEEEEARKRLDKREVKDLRALADILDVSSSGSKRDVIDRIVEFCQKPTGSGHAFRSKKAKGGKRGSGGGGGKGSGKKGKKKGGGGGGMNGYMVFVKEKREGGEGEGMSVTEFGKKMGEEWRALDDGEKEEFKKKAQALKGHGEAGEDDEEGEDEEGEEGDEEDGEGEEGEEEGEADGGDEGRANGSKKASASKDDDEEDDEASMSEEQRTTLEKLRASIASILKSANLESLTVKGVKEQLTLEHGEEVIAAFAKKIKNIVIRAVQAAPSKD